MSAAIPVKTALTLHFSPVIDPTWIALICTAGLLFIAVSWFAYRRGLTLRLLALGAFLLLFLNPSLLEQEQKTVKDTGFIVVDRSASQHMGQRKARTDKALAALKSAIEQAGQVDIRIIEAPQDDSLSTETRLFEALDTAAATIPQKQRAGAIFITDGQIHDVPQNPLSFTQYGPVHTLLSGEKDEKDRQIIVTKAPAYGLVGKDVTIQYRVEDTKNIGAREAEVTLTMHDGSQMGMVVPVNTDQTLILRLDHPGENVFALEAEGVKNELTLANNKTAILINGVRDRLKVLLVSGVPHAGERPWRDLLTSDPGVDLVHFTILREPHKFDFTPQHELSLIAFPVQELFEEKLYDFDLIIFDHYRQNNILPDFYFENIVQYVKRGGAFLEASGPSFAGKSSLYTTPLQEILPGEPTGQVFGRAFRPELSELGFKHPVTAGLIWDNREIKPNEEPHWGPWLRQIDIRKKRGDILMTGIESKPLVILDRFEKGRVAQIASDHLWLWSRGFEGGGPHAELLRRIVHWLMKEPELDERALDVQVYKNTITIRKQDLAQQEETIALTLPDGESTTITLKPNGQGWLEAKYDATQLGIYAFEDANGARKFAIIGTLNPPELRGVKTTPEKLAPLVAATRGATVWLEDHPTPRIRFLTDASRYGGNDWLALRRNRDFTVTGVKEIPLLPEWLRLCLLFIVVAMMWWREGRT